MNNVLSWIAGIAVSLLIIALVVYGSPGRQSYYRARGVIIAREAGAIHLQNSPFEIAAGR